MKRILVTGGAGFVGSNISIALKERFSDCDIVALDNLYRKGSELNLPRLAKSGVVFIQGDVRKPEDLKEAGKIDFLIECSAEPSVLAGKDGCADYLIQTNLDGAVNCIDLCRRNDAGMIFLSTSRVYPIEPLVNGNIIEEKTRYTLSDEQSVPGLSSSGVAEDFPMEGARSLYGATKFAAEIMLAEYRHAFSLPVIINRCGVIAGPWQFGKADQGIAAFWTASHIFKKSLRYIGFNGKGMQVRDMLHIDDLVELVFMQLKDPEKFSARSFFNVGGGLKSSASLLELTDICENASGNKLEISSEPETRYADIPVYITDNSNISGFCGWKPEKNVETIVKDISEWIKSSPKIEKLFN
jgi:CDP-paratose 2-epimerase